MSNINRQQSRKYQLTQNNPEGKLSHDEIKEKLATKFPSFRYCAMVDEIGANGTPHTHIFICFNGGVRFSTLKKHFPYAHIETARGSIKQNLDYLLKAGKWTDTEKAETTIAGSFEEFGERPQENKGKRGDLEELYHMIVEEELTNAEILQINNDYILQIDKLDKIRTTHLQDKFRGTRRLDLEVTYVFGVTGMGKSRDILDTYGDENVYRVTDYKHPFDGYSIEDVLVLEEFRNSMPLKSLLDYLDIYPIQLPARYANKYACYNKVFIVSNWKFERQFELEQRDDRESYDAFLRRIHKVKEYTENGIIEYDSVKAYLGRNNQFRTVSELPKAEQQEIETLFPPTP